jgi:tetratricopeptide (TPR) repeat protein
MSKKKSPQIKSGKVFNEQPKKLDVAEIKPESSAEQKNNVETITIDTITRHDGLLKKIFYATSAVMLILMMFMSVGAGINEDDKYQNNYAQSLYKYYSTFGSDTTALFYTPEQGSMHFYGGFFDLMATVTNVALNTNNPETVAYHSVRHVLNSILGFIAIFFTALLARYIGGWYMGLLVLFFMFFSPRFLGDSFINPKDIPFAAGYIMSLYYISVFLKTMEKPKVQTLVGLGLGIALTISSRVGGLLLLGYIVMFIGIELWRKYGLASTFGNTKRLFTIAKYALLAVVPGYFLAMLFWPYGLSNPFSHPFEALSEMTKRAVNIKLLFNGGLVWGQNRPWHYPLTWMYLTIPLYVLSGLAVFVIMIRKIIKDYTLNPVHLLLFACFFPIIYVIIKGSTLHDSWRHLIFVYPAMVVLAGLGWFTLIRYTMSKKGIFYSVLAVLGLLIIEPASFIARNPAYPYVYFNPIAGGISGAFGRFETDYWGTSVKQGVEWLEKQGVFEKATEEKPVKIATNSYYVACAYLAKYGKKVNILYTKYYNRDEQLWDYALFISRFVAPEQQTAGKWPVKSYSIKNIKANNTPILTVYKDSIHYAFEGQQFMKAKDYPNAINSFNKELAIHPDNELAYLRLGQAYLASSNFEKSMSLLDSALALVPNWDSGLYMKGLNLQNQNKLEEAEKIHLKVLELNGRYSPSIQQLAAIYSTQGKHAFALQYLEELVEMEGGRKDIIQFAVQIYERAGSHKAETFKKYLQQMK